MSEVRCGESKKLIGYMDGNNDFIPTLSFLNKMSKDEFVAFCAKCGQSVYVNNVKFN